MTKEGNPDNCNVAYVETGVNSRGRGTYRAGIVKSVPLLQMARKSVNFLCHFDDPTSSNWSLKI